MRDTHRRGAKAYLSRRDITGAQPEAILMCGLCTNATSPPSLTAHTPCGFCRALKTEPNATVLCASATAPLQPAPPRPPLKPCGFLPRSYFAEVEHGARAHASTSIRTSVVRRTRILFILFLL